MDGIAVPIIAIIFGTTYAIISAILKYKKESKAQRPVDASIANELENLKERVAVLEKIVTDEKYQLNKEFESLK